MAKNLVFWTINLTWISKVKVRNGRKIKGKIGRFPIKLAQPSLLFEEKIAWENEISKSTHSTFPSKNISYLFIFRRIDKNLDGSQTGKLKDSSRDIADSDLDKDNVKSTTDSKPKDPPPILKYIKTHVMLIISCL